MDMKKMLFVVLAVLAIATTADARSRKDNEIRLKLLTSTEYGKAPLFGIVYPDAIGEQTQYMDTWTKKTHHFGVEMLRLTIPVENNIKAFTGLRMDRYEYYFMNRYTFGYDGQVYPIELTRDKWPNYKNSELRTTYWSIPAGINVRLDRKWSVEAYAFAGVLGKSVNIVRRPKDKTFNPGGLNDFQYGIGAAIMRRHLGLSFKYIPSSVFKEGVGPDTNTFSFGIILH